MKVKISKELDHGLYNFQTWEDLLPALAANAQITDKQQIVAIYISKEGVHVKIMKKYKPSK